MKNKKIDSGHVGLAFELKEKQEKEKKMNENKKWAWLMWAQHKKKIK